MDKKTEENITMAAFSGVMLAGLNAGLSAVVNFNFVDMLVGTMPTASTIVYGLFGASALWLGYQKFGSGKKDLKI